MTNSKFSPASKVWIYQSSRPFNQDEMKWLNQQLETFTRQWTAHNQQLKANGEVVEDRFILLMADETHTQASGCSIDKSVYFIKEIEKKLNVELFNRFLLTYNFENILHTVHLDRLPLLMHENILTNETLVYNTLVSTKDEFDHSFLIPLQSSWARQFAD